MTGFKILILLPPLPKCYNSDFKQCWDGSRDFKHARQTTYQLNSIPSFNFLKPLSPEGHQKAVTQQLTWVTFTP